MTAAEDLNRGLGRIEGKVDILLKKATKQECRLQSLESSRNWVRGAVATISAVLAIAWAFILRKL